MGATRTEEKDPKYKVITDLPWSETYIRERILSYQQLSDQVEKSHLKSQKVEKMRSFN